MKRIKLINKQIFMFVLVFSSSIALADKTIISTRVYQVPIIDGIDDDKVWLEAKEVITHDSIAKIDIRLKTIYTKNEIFFLVKFKQKTPNQSHKKLVWDKKNKLYKIGKKREDTFVFKWNMEPFPVDLTLKSIDNYKADIWYWKAFRTDHAGYADDKIQIFSSFSSPKAHRILASNGKTFYLSRKGDQGRSSYKNNIPTEFIRETIDSYVLREPSDSRADVRAKGYWHKGLWTLEFSRKLNTTHGDDISLQPGLNYLFGVSRFEVAGRSANPDIEIPLFGSGDITEHLLLKFK